MRIEHFLEALQEHVGDLPGDLFRDELESAILRDPDVGKLVSLITEEELTDRGFATHIFNVVLQAVTGPKTLINLKEQLRREGLEICSRAEAAGGFNDQDRAELSAIYARAEGM